jgi:protein PhnA
MIRAAMFCGHRPVLPPQPGCLSEPRRKYFFGERRDVADENDEYVYDEATGEWRPASEMAAVRAEQARVRDASGNVLADGDSATLIKDLKVKGANQTLKQGTVIKSIRLTDNVEEIDCRHDTIKGLVLRTEFVRKRK